MFQKITNGGNLSGIARRKIVGNSEDIAKCRVYFLMLKKNFKKMISFNNGRYTAQLQLATKMRSPAWFYNKFYNSRKESKR